MTANQTVRLDLGTKDGVKSMRIGFSGQRLTAHGRLVMWTRFITERGLREQLRAAARIWTTMASAVPVSWSVAPA